MKLTITFLMVILTTVVRSQTVSCSDPFLPSDWTGIGPYEYTEDNQQGRVMSIWVHPEDENLMYIGTRASGIWKTTDGGNNWFNLTGYDHPALGVWSITGRRTPSGPTILYGNTQFWGSDRNVYGQGLIYSKDNGATWTKENSYPPEFTFNGTVKQFKTLDIEMSGTKVYITNGQYLFQRQTSLTTDTWNSNAILNLDLVSVKPGHLISEIDFSPVDTNRAIVSSWNASQYDLLYTANAASASPTWLSMPIPVIPSDTGEDQRFISYTSTFISADTLASLIRWQLYNFDPEPDEILDTMCLVLYDRNDDNPIIISSQKYDDLIGPLLQNGSYHGLEFPTGVSDTFFVAYNTQGLHRGKRPNSGPIDGVRVSSPNAGIGVKQTHTDIRDYSIIGRSILIATDGGVSSVTDYKNFVSTNSANDNAWQSINGFGLNITEFNSISSSEFEVMSLVAMSPDGNSFAYKKQIVAPFEQKFATEFGSDAYFISRPMNQVDTVVYSFNYGGTRTLSNTRGSDFTDIDNIDNGELEDIYFPRSGIAQNIDATNFAYRPFGFDDNDHFWSGTTDIFVTANAFSAALQDSFMYRSKTNFYNPIIPPSNITTYTSISAFEQFVTTGVGTNPDTTHMYYSTLDKRTPSDPVKLVYAEYYVPAGTEVFLSQDITPLLDEDPGVSSVYLVDHAIATDIAIDEDNPDKLWVSYGFNREGGEGRILDYVLDEDHWSKQGRIYFSDNRGSTWTNVSNGLPNYPVICMEYWQGSDDIIFAGTDVGVYIWNKDEAEWQCFDTGDQLPYCSVSDIEINYCTMNLRISTFGFGLWETPLPLGSIYSRAGGQPLEITADETWT